MASATDSLSKYQKLTDLEHVLKRPDTYIGPINPTDAIDFIAVVSPTTSIVEKEKDKDSTPLATVTMVRRPITFIPGLYKLFDEGLVNMRDHAIRQAHAIADGNADALPVTYLDITCSATDGTICMTNDGDGVAVAKHPEHDMWIPEMIFGHLRTSTNYDESKKEKIVGGKNGFGVKLVFIWSTWGAVETVDHVRGLKYYQEFHSNLTVISPPKITKCSKTKPYTKISFRPDYIRFGLPSNVPTADMMSLFMKRVFDIAAVTDRSIRVKYNGETVPVKHFQQYVDLYIGGKGEAKRAYESPDARWEYVVCLTPTDEFAHVSFVNGIYTPKGGKHVEYILGQVVRKLAALIKKKKKIDVKPNTIKEQLMLFLRCDIENPSFSSQTKDELGTNVAAFGSSCTVSDDFIEKIAKMGVIDAACALTEVKDTKAAKKTDGVKSRTLRGIPKLMDANLAGTDKSDQCTIIFCEGDSAKAGIVSGLSKEDRNFIGVYPMKGKIFNVRGEATKRISENHEIAEIKQIMGLETGREYTPDLVRTKLRYGKILFMTDQDLDGSHIKGLGINLFQSEWPSLAHIPGFIGFMNTPILKATRAGRGEPMLFYNDGEYEEWKRTLGANAEAQDAALKAWTIKYYKGLGTSTSKEFKEYFERKKTVSFVHGGETCDDSVDMAFNKKRPDDRKTWLASYSRDAFLDTRKPEVSYSEFINQEMIHFSVYDNERSIPNLMDGQKLGQRKILYAAFKKGLTKTEIKVAQFSGYVSEHSGYHHGEASLNATIVGMAQNFVGSNNINLFEPNGQFGTRIQGGKDSASERYIFTILNPLTRMLFRPEDDGIMKYLNDDGELVEPVFYAPTIPLVLVNGTKGIGTGFSTDIMCHNPLQIIAYMRALIADSDETSGIAGTAGTSASGIAIEPFYQGFKGTIAKLNSSESGGGSGSGPAKYAIKGSYAAIDDHRIRVTELPIGFWTEDFKAHLEALMEPTTSGTGANAVHTPPHVKEYCDMSTDSTVDFMITMTQPIAERDRCQSATSVTECNGLEKTLKLYTTQSTSNMNLFDENEKLRRYETVYDIARAFFPVRREIYERRRSAMLAKLLSELEVLSNRAKYIQEQLDDTLDLRRQKRESINALLASRGYAVRDGGYDYLLKMPQDGVTEEKVTALMTDRDSKQREYAELMETSASALWIRDLDDLESAYSVIVERKRRENDAMSAASANASTSAGKVKKTMIVKRKVPAAAAAAAASSHS
jgi:DNA topoisomerase-2